MMHLQKQPEQAPDRSAWQAQVDTIAHWVKKQKNKWIYENIY